jgi:hypothetical protein
LTVWAFVWALDSSLNRQQGDSLPAQKSVVDSYSTPTLALIQVVRNSGDEVLNSKVMLNVF